MEYAEKEKGLDLPYAQSQPDVYVGTNLNNRPLYITIDHYI